MGIKAGISVVASGACSAAVGSMLIIHTFLICKNWTSIEASLLSSSGHYSKIGIFRAIKFTFGDNPLLWAIPYFGPSGLKGL